VIPARRQALRRLARPCGAAALGLAGRAAMLRPLGLHALARGPAALLATALGGCALLPRPRTIPMDVIDLPGRRTGTAPGPGPAPDPAEDLLVFLPGAYSLPQEFIDEGFVAALREGPREGHSARPGLHLQIADAHLGYFQDQTVLERLHADVVLPAAARGVRRLWLVGISLGGFAALGYAERHGAELAARGPLRLAGALAIAPYLGTAALMQSISVAGGARAWAAKGGRSDTGIQTDDAAAGVWRWLCQQAEQAENDTPGEARTPVWLAYGEQDRFAAAHRQMATLLPPDRVSHAPGGHDWPAWRRLWQDWLAQGLLPGAAPLPR
jgi:hypothetical protein